MRLGHRHRHTSDRNARSSSGTLTGATSKNLNCHLSRVSVAMSEGGVPASAYRSDCHTAATVPCSLLPQSQLSYVTKPGEELGAGTAMDEPRASAPSRLACRPMTAASVSPTSARSSPSPLLHHFQPSTSTLLSCAIIHGPPFFALTFYTCATLFYDSLPRVPLFNTRCAPKPARPFVSRSTSDFTHPVHH
jgi:hypothetical protein